MTNKEYLDALATEDPTKLAQWFDQEHVDEGAMRARCRHLQDEVFKLSRKLGMIEEVLS